MLTLVILGILIFLIINARKLELFRGHLFSNAVKIMLFISDAQYYVLVKLGKLQEEYTYSKLQGN